MRLILRIRAQGICAGDVVTEAGDVVISTSAIERLDGGNAFLARHAT